MPDVLLGVLFTLLAAMLSNYAPILQKHALGSVVELSLARVRRSIRALVKTPRWVAGFVLKMVSTLFFLIGMNFIGLAVAVPLLSCGIIVLVYFAIVKLGERLKPREYIGITFLAAMPVLLVFSGIGSIQASILDAGTFVAFAITNVVLGACACGLLKVGARASPGGWIPDGLPHAIAAAIISIVGGLFIQVLTSLVDASNLLAVPGMILQGDPVAIISTASVLVGLAIFLVGAMVQQIALQKGKATIIVPLEQSVLNVLAILGGFLIFRQAISSWFFYVLAIALMFTGIALLARLEGRVAGHVDDAQAISPTADSGART